jgi:hypothetical protein
MTAATLRFCSKVRANQRIVNSPDYTKVVDDEKRKPGHRQRTVQARERPGHDCRAFLHLVGVSLTEQQELARLDKVARLEPIEIDAA